jgi:hypothetical protein
MKTLCPKRMGSCVDVGALLDWLEVTLELEDVRLEELVVLTLVDALLEPETEVELEVVVFVTLPETEDDVKV